MSVWVQDNLSKQYSMADAQCDYCGDILSRHNLKEHNITSINCTWPYYAFLYLPVFGLNCSHLAELQPFG